MKTTLNTALINVFMASTLAAPMVYAQTLQVDPDEVVLPESEDVIFEDEGDTLFAEDNRDLDTDGLNYLCNQETIDELSIDVQEVPGSGNTTHSVSFYMTHAVDLVKVYDEDGGTYIKLSNASIPHMTCGPYIFQKDSAGAFAEDAGVYVYLNESNDKYDGSTSLAPQVVYGGNGHDVIVGGIGKDEIYGGNGEDKLYGRGGNDVIWGGGNDDFIKGNLGNDYLNGGLGDDTIYGGWGNDDLYGDRGVDLMMGENGSDTLIDCNETDRDQMYGGEGADVFIKYTAAIEDEDDDDLEHNFSVPICVTDL